MMAIKEKILIELLDLWFESRQTLSNTDFEMIKKMYWIVSNKGVIKNA